METQAQHTSQGPALSSWRGAGSTAPPHLPSHLAALLAQVVLLAGLRTVLQQCWAVDLGRHDAPRIQVGTELQETGRALLGRGSGQDFRVVGPSGGLQSLKQAC